MKLKKEIGEQKLFS